MATAKLTEEREEEMRAQRYLRAQKEQEKRAQRFRDAYAGHARFQQEEAAREKLRSRSLPASPEPLGGFDHPIIPAELLGTIEMMHEAMERMTAPPMFIRRLEPAKPDWKPRPGAIGVDWAWGDDVSVVYDPVTDQTVIGTAPVEPRSDFERDLVARASLVKEPDRDAIPRMALGESPSLGPRGDDALAIKAEKLLGYRVLRQARNLPGQLRRALQDLEIKPLDSAAVEKYKTEMQLFRQLEIDKRTGRDNLKYFRANNTRIVAGRETVIIATWRKTDLSAYNARGQQIPEFVLRKAVAIAEEVPNVTFMVDELVEKENVVDPFLWAIFHDERFVIEVWGENKFERTL